MHSMSFSPSSMLPRSTSSRPASKKYASMKRASAKQASHKGTVDIGASRARRSRSGTVSLPIAHPNAKVNVPRKGRSRGLLFRAPDGDVVQVKNGFSCDAFFIGSTTAFLRRLWPLLVAGGIAFMAAAYFDGFAMPSTRGAGIAAVAAVFYVAFMLFCGINGNRWVAQSLRRRGYIVVGDA